MASMKRDMDLVRSILLKIESLDHPDLDELLEPGASYDDRAMLVYHMRMLIEDAGYVRGIDSRSIGHDDWLNLELTWQGHEFLDAIRDPEIWRRTKEGARTAGVAGIEFIWELAKAFGKQVIKERIGIDLT
jgi:hypothetical protein